MRTLAATCFAALLALPVPARADDIDDWHNEPSRKRAPRGERPARQADEEDLVLRDALMSDGSRARLLDAEGDTPADKEPAEGDKPSPSRRSRSSSVRPAEPGRSADPFAPVKAKPAASTGLLPFEATEELPPDDNLERVPSAPKQDEAQVPPEEEQPKKRRSRHTPFASSKRARGRLALLDEKGHGVGLEILGGLVLLDSATGGTTPRFHTGASLAYQVGRFFRPESELLFKGLYAELSYLFTTSSEGTDWVRVRSTYHHLSLAALFGYPFTDLNLLVYAKAGPALFVEPVTYDVQHEESTWTGFRGGIVYGVGARYTNYFDSLLGLAARLELTRYRRWYHDDTSFLLGVGLVF